MSTNPFEVIEARQTEISERLDRIERLLKAPQPEKPDRITSVGEACEVVGGEGTPVSHAFIYSMTSRNLIPFERFGGRLVFSRNRLIAWRDSRTSSKLRKDDIVSQSVAASAEKKFRR